MGGSASKAAAEADKAQKEVLQMMVVLQNKRDEFLARVEATRGQTNQSTSEVQGGRTVMRQSAIRVKTSAGVDDNISSALDDFMSAAQGGNKAKSSAIEGATKLVKAGLDALFGASEGTGMEKTGFMVLFMNYAFVRVDYLVYTYTASGKSWGAQDSRAGACYVSDLAVLDPATLTASEIDFLLGQALTVPKPAGKATASSVTSDLELIMKVKIMLVQSAILSKKLARPDIDYPIVQAIVDQLVTTQKQIKALFDNMSDYSAPAAAAAPAAK